MTKKRKGPPELHELRIRLCTLDKLKGKNSPPQIADLYLAAVGLLCHLKIDQNTLITASYRREGPEAKCPPPTKIPAMTAVIQDPRLFQALLNCLKASSSSGNDGSELGGGLGSSGASRLHGSSSSHLLHHSGHPHHHHHHHHHANSTFAGRKRSSSNASEVDNHASKAMKLSHSPVPTASRLFSINRNQAEANASSEHSPTLNVQVVAATILYMAFSHVDHWPPQLVGAYAEDCFGPRSWVDDERCKLLVDNLSLAHDSKEDGKDIQMEDASMSEDAVKVGESYSKLHELILEDEAENDQASPSAQQLRRGSLSSQGSNGPIANSLSASTSSLPRSNSQDESDGVAAKTKRERKAKLKSAIKSSKAGGADDDGSSSSSGEEDEEVIVTTKSARGEDGMPPRKKKSSAAARGDSRALSPSGSSQAESDAAEAFRKLLSGLRLYPLEQKKLNLTRVRQRYFGANLEYAHNAISLSLRERLEAKAKQNSSLLQSLHFFTSIPVARSLIAGNLEKWLQSPGLSGLARTLFVSTVNQMKHADPPLPADMEVVKKILSMRLKANQLSAHIENVTAMAARIPTGAVARQMYHQLLTEILTTIRRGADASTSDHLKMIGAVYSVMPKSLSAEGMAASFLLMIGDSIGDVTSGQTRLQRSQLVKHLKHIIQLVAQQLGGIFDSCKLLESLMTFDIKDESWTVEEEEDRARLMYQCVMLLVPPSPKEAARHPAKSIRKGSIAAEPDQDALKEKLTTARKLLLTWFCTDYGPRFPPPSPEADEDENGAGTPDFSSPLGGLGEAKRYPKWLKTARCLLFMESSDSPYMQQFVRDNHLVEENDPNWPDEKYRIDQCYEHGCDFDDEMMWAVLKSASLEEDGIRAEMALTLLEHLFESCSVKRRGSLKISDMMLTWELYTLVLYEPPETVPGEYQKPTSQFDDAEEDDGSDAMQIDTADLDLPHLALPGRWWRVTTLALVMCGVAPKQIGATVWEEHPTLRAMIKMVTSLRYRFPTVDCDDTERSDMKKNEQIMREEESRISEILFMPPKPPPKEDEDMEESNHGRARASARQQQKRERALKKQREKEAAEALLEENRRKKRLRAAQKTIMLWDPTNPARKPPREAAELLVAVESHFGLSKTFQRNVEPDFLLMTIGKTTRGAIERAYDWLIPIISTMPDTIARLHASASCVLLLRAYGTEGDERAQLKELSSPLLRHVSDSLTGRFGESDAVRAFDLLLTDVASHNPDRRRCARRVLYDSIGKHKASGDDASAPKSSSWMLNILRLEHAKSLVSDAIRHMSTATTFERGTVLRNLLMALDELIIYAKKNEIDGDWDFTNILIGLISSRPSVCAETMDRFPDLRTLGIKTVYQKFQATIADSTTVDPSTSVTISLCRDSQSEKIVLSLALLQAASVLLSIWKEGNGAASKEQNGSTSAVRDGQDATAAITDLAGMLLHPIEAQKSQLPDESDARGLASARMLGSEKGAVSVESWVMLAKARSDKIARRAALTAPTAFLPRLLLCSGLPRASLLTMIDRLGKMGDKASESDAVFNQLLVPSATSEWDISRLGQRREVARKLLGRLSAYLRLNDVAIEKDKAEISTSFLEWLSNECAINDKPRKLKNKQKSKAAAVGLSTLMDASSLLQSLSNTNSESNVRCFDEELETDLFRPGMESRTAEVLSDTSEVESSIRKSIEENQPDVLEELLRIQIKEVGTKRSASTAESNNHRSLATLVLRTYVNGRLHHDSLNRVIQSWVPQLSQSSGCPELWQELFSKQDRSLSEKLDCLLSRCISSWCPHHVETCCEWILSRSKNIGDSKCCVARLTRYLVLTSGQHSVQVDGFSARIPVRGMKTWGKSEEFVKACANIAFEGMKAASLLDNYTDILCRNELPDWLVLVLLLSKCGRVQMKFICEAILQRISQPTEDLSLSLLRAVFLRLYVSNPLGMNLGIAMIRAVLMAAAEEYAAVWLDWRSPLDGQLQDMLETVIGGNGMRLVRPLADMSKKHPLLILRRSHLMVKFLERDAAVVERSSKELRGIVHGQSLTGPLNAVKSGRLVKLNVRHWGFSYTEHVWIALLDIISAVPGPVLFSCGLHMGFLDFLNVNMRLMFVQSQLRRSERESRLRDKLKDLFATFRKSNKSGWEEWMKSPAPGLPSLGETKNVMICCDLADPKETVEVRKEPS